MFSQSLRPWAARKAGQPGQVEEWSGAHPSRQQAHHDHRRAGSHLHRPPAGLGAPGRRRQPPALAGGVTSNWQITLPQPVWLSRGAGSKIYDVDGNEYVDLHGGYGAALAGHAHPAIVAAITRPGRRCGTHFAQPTTDASLVAEELARRFGLPLWRFANSGTEATMDAVHLMRAITGRDLIIKVEGGYHGHHDSVQVSVMPDPRGRARRRRPPRCRPVRHPGQAITGLTLVAAFNDLGSVRRLLDAHPGQVAGMIVEPIMMNAGIIRPLPGYLAGLRDLLHAHGALLTFDEVKTGLTVGPGGVTALSGVTPDIVCLAKSLGGGVAVAAIGGTAEVMEHVASGKYEMVGTFNGNPLAMAAARAMLTEVATPAAYDRLARLRDRRAVDRAQREIARHGRPRGGVGGCQGLRGVLAPAGARLPRVPRPPMTRSATRTGCSSTTAGCSCRPGGRSSSG